jgi:hypothetical protein
MVVRPMCPMVRYPLLQMLLSPVRRSQQKMLALVSAAITDGARAPAGAGHLAVKLGSALTRFYRLQRHSRIDEQRLTAQRLQRLGRGQRLSIARSWTAWPPDLRMLAVAVVVGGRTLALPAAALAKTAIRRLQNLRETTVLPRLVHMRRSVGQTAGLLWDRAGPVRGVGVWASGQRAPWWFALVVGTRAPHLARRAGGALCSAQDQ